MNVRECALRVLLDIETRETKSHIAVQNEIEAHPDLTTQDRRFLRCLVQGTLEKQMLLDERINSKSKVKVRKMKPLIRQVLRMSAYQLFFMDRVPDSAVCNEAVKLVQKYHMQGLKGFVNGVLRSMTREEKWPECSLSVQYSVPQWILDLWMEEYGEAAMIRMLESMNEEKHTCFRIREDVCSAEKVLASLTEEGVRYEQAPFPAGAWVILEAERLDELTAMKKGWIQIQDISSMMVGALSGVTDGQAVLDVCAAPGGKSMHVAEKMHGTGSVISCDLTDYKVRLIRENVERTGLTNVHPMRQDALQYRSDWKEAMDVVIADLPCSGLGVIGRKPEIRYNMTLQGVEDLAELQRSILKNVASYVKPGGLLLYSTCTVTPQENRENRRFILENLPFREEAWPEAVIPERFRERAAGGELQILPGTDPCDGFYLARFRRL